MNASDAMILASNFKYVFCDENGKEIGKPVDYTSIRSDFNMNQGDEGMKKEELLNALKGMFKDGTVTSDELSETLGVKLMNDEVSTSVAMFKEVKGMLGDTDVKEFVKTALKQKEDAKKEAFAKLRDDALQASFIVANELRLAKHMFKLTDGDKEAVDAEIKRIQEDPDMQEEHKTALKNMNYTPSGFVGDSQDNEPAQNGMMEA
jgi:hypothetical protein